MKNVNEIKNEKRLTSYLEDSHGSYYSLLCEKCPLNINSCDYVCDDVLANRLAKYESIGRDFMELPEDEVVPVEVLEMSLKVSFALANLSEHNMTAKKVLDCVFAFIHYLYGEQDDTPDEGKDE